MFGGLHLFHPNYFSSPQNFFLAGIKRPRDFTAMLISGMEEDALNPSSAGHGKKKPTKVAVRKMAREARWQQRVLEAQPGDLYDSPGSGQVGSLEESRVKQEKADKYAPCPPQHSYNITLATVQDQVSLMFLFLWER